MNILWQKGCVRASKWIFHVYVIDLFKIWLPLISIKLLSSDKQINPIVRKSMSNLATHLSFRAVGQTLKWQAFEKMENKRQMYGGQAWVDWLLYICLSRVWPRALKLGYITNVDMLFRTMGLICLFYEKKLMLIGGRHVSNRSLGL